MCDVTQVPRELATDSERILPGEGVLDLSPILDHLTQIAYNKAVSIELLNPQIWQVPPRQFGEIGITALRKFLNLATP